MAANGSGKDGPPPERQQQQEKGKGELKAGTGIVLSLGLKRANSASSGSGGGGGGGFGAAAGGRKPAAFGGRGDGSDSDGDGDEAGRAHFITSLDDKRGVKGEGEEKAPLVIAVPIPRWARGQEQKKEEEKEEGGKGKEKKEKTLEELAAEAVAREAMGDGPTDAEGEGSIRVIEVRAPSHVRKDVGADAPMLVKNAVPVPKDITDDKARLLYELSLREEDIDPSSDVYKTVPVEEFGAALLRGMGWKGPSEEDVTVFQAQPRPQGLGLGANAAVLELDPEGTWRRKGKGNGKGRAPPGGKEGEAKRKEALAKAAAERLRSQVLRDGDVVRLTKGEHGGQRAMVTRAAGVAGVAMVEVELEGAGQAPKVVRIKQTDCFPVSATELGDKPFQHASASARNGGGGGGGGGGGSKRGRLRSPPMAEEEEGGGKKRRKEGKEKRRSRSRSRSRDRKEKDNKGKQHRRSSKEKQSSSSSGAGGCSTSSNLSWLLPHIRVRIVTERALGGDGTGRGARSYYRKKGVVVDVPTLGQATVRLEEGGVLLEGVKARHLETALPPVGGVVLVLKGPHRMKKAKLLESDARREEGVVQLREDLQVVTLPLDDIAEYRGLMGDEDDMDDD